MKQIYSKEEAQEKIKDGINKTANAIKATLGGKGKNVLIANLRQKIRFTKDGVSVAKEIILKDEFENVGANLVKEASEKTADVVGDGTTTSALLVQSLINDSLIKIRAGADPLLIKSGIEKGLKEAVEVLNDSKIDIKKDSQLEFVASISANDPEIGKIIADIFKEIGKDGVVTIESSANLGFEKEIVKGLQFDKGFASGFFVTDRERAEAVLEDACVIITDKKISVFNEIVPALDNLIKSGKRQFLLIADDYDESVIAQLALNKLKGTFVCSAVKAPGFGERKREYLQDICVLTGASLVSESSGKKWDSITPEDFGSAKKVVSTKDTTTIIGGNGDSKEIDRRVQFIQMEIQNTKNEYEKADLRSRIAKLKGGISILRVGGSTEGEIKEKKDRVEDAVAATKAALEEGIVLGGGIALLKARKDIKLKLEGDEKKGLEVFLNSLEAPFMTILANGGKNGGEVIKKLKGNAGFNIKTGKIEKDMFKAGIIDPYKVVKTCLLNAVSVAGEFIRCEAFIVEYDEKE